MNSNPNNPNNNTTSSNPPSTSSNEHKIVNSEKEHAGKGFIQDLKANQSPNFNKKNSKRLVNPKNKPYNGFSNSLKKNNLNFPKNIGNSSNKLGNSKIPNNNIPRVPKVNSNIPNNSIPLSDNSQTNPNLTDNNSSNNNLQSSSNQNNLSNKNSSQIPKNLNGSKLVNNIQNINNLKNNLNSEDAKQVTGTIIKEAIKKQIVTFLVANLPIIIPIILILIIIIIIIAVLVAIVGGNSNTEVLEKNNVSYANECGFTISQTNLTKEEFKEKLTSYAIKNKSDKKSYYTLFASNADNIYDIATSHNVNPELVVVRAVREGFDPGGNNFWGINCTNTGGGKDCKTYSSFNEGVNAFVKIAADDESLTEFMSHYSYIGEYWYNPGSSGLGGCYYYKYIYNDNTMPKRVKNACTNGLSCSEGGGSNCVATTAEDQQAYAAWQVKSMFETRVNIFGEVDSSFCQGATDIGVENIIKLSDSEAWEGLTGTATNYKTVSELEMTERMTEITIPIRVWASNSKNDYETKKVNKTLTVNKLVAPLFTAFFNDIYTNAPNFVINSSEIYCYSYRQKTGGGRLSSHAYGTACDINWNSTGNGYGDKVYTKDSWSKLNKSKTKYQIIYKDSDIVKIAHKYTLSWGGEWNSTTDAMHFSFIGDETRSSLQAKYSNG